MNLLVLFFDISTISLCVKGFVRLMVLTNTTVMSPVQTDSSNTAARGEPKRNMIIESMALVTASPIVAFKRLLPITVHIAARVIKTRSVVSILFITISA
jgi:hypothetical protein